MKRRICPVSRLHYMRDNGDCVSCAVQDEIRRFNIAITVTHPEELVIRWPDSLCNGHTICYMDSDFWLHTKSPSGMTASFCMCNDDRWARLLRMVDIPRHPLFQ